MGFPLKAGFRVKDKERIEGNFSKSPGTHNRINALIELQ
jgi:hypothetical protein